MNDLKRKKIKEIINKYRHLATSSFFPFSEYAENKTIERMINHELFYFKNWGITPEATIRDVKKEIRLIKEKYSEIEDNVVSKKYKSPQLYKTIRNKLENGETINTSVPDYETIDKGANYDIALTVFPNKVLVDYLNWLMENCYKSENHIDGENPDNASLKEIRDIPLQRNILKKEDVKMHGVGTDQIIKILYGALDLGITREEFNVFKNNFNMHKLTQFGGNEFQVKKLIRVKKKEGEEATKEIKKVEVDVVKLVDKIFDIADLFEENTIKEYFINAAFLDVNRENTNHRWSETKMRFNKAFKEKREQLKLRNNTVQMTYQDWKNGNYHPTNIKELFQDLATTEDRNKILAESKEILFRLGNELAKEYINIFERSNQDHPRKSYEQLKKEQLAIIDTIAEGKIKGEDGYAKVIVTGSKSQDWGLNDLQSVHYWLKKFENQMYGAYVASSPEITLNWQEYDITPFKAFGLLELYKHLNGKRLNSIFTKDTNTSKLKSELVKYGFFDLPKVNALSVDGKDKMVNFLISNQIPYCMAMFDFLEFIQYLEKEHFPIKDKRNKEIAKWFNSDKDGRSIKGNINSLLKGSGESKDRYTAYKHKEKVKKDYETIK